MKAIVEKLGLLAKRLSEEKGKLTLFALVLPGDAFVWDLIVSAEWIDKDNASSLRYLAQEVQKTLTTEELLTIAGIVLFESSTVSGNFSEVRSETGWEENDIDFFGQHVQKAYVFQAPVENLQIWSELSG